MRHEVPPAFADPAPAIGLAAEDGVACDVVVVGGGPAGSTAAALLAQAGRRVVILEKEAHPRFHIGESLLPQNLALFQQLGVLDEVRTIGVHKPGAEFVSDEHGRRLAFDFADALDTAFPSSFQVKRAELDALLFANAARRGAEAHERMRVTGIELRTGGIDLGTGGRRSQVTAEGPDGREHRWAARFVVDASGRDGVIARKLGCRAADKSHNNAAVFTHFEGVAPVGEVETGHITVHLFDEGWFWVIPLRGGITSIGVVAPAAFFKGRKGDLDSFLLETIRTRSPSLRRRIADARIVMPAIATGNYSYRASHMVGDGYALVGDAYAFIDPVFSSGVMLGMQSGVMAAAAVDAWLDEPEAAAPLFRAFERKVDGSLDAFSWLIRRINDPTLRDLFMSPSNRFKMRDGVVSILGGNAHGNGAARVPILAFKATFYLFQAIRRVFGLRVIDGRLVRRLEPAAPGLGTPVTAA